MSSTDDTRVLDGGAAGRGLEAWAGAFLALLLLLGAVTFSVSPMNGEDYALTRQFFDAGLLERLGWAVGRSVQQVTSWNARLGEQLAIFWMAMPRTWFAIANLIAMTLFACLLALFATPQERWRRETLVISSLLAMAACYLFWPRLEIFFWRTTAAGYLQPLVMTLLLVLPFHSSRACRLLLGSWPAWALFVLLGVLGGLSFENVPPALLPYMALMTWGHFRQRSEFRWRLGLIVLAYLAGWAMLMMAPSTQARSAWYAAAYSIPEPSVAYFHRQALAVLGAFLESSWGLLLALGVAAVAGIGLRPGAWRQPASFYLLCIPAGLCVASVVKAPYIEPRAFSLAWCIAVIALVRFVHEGMQAISGSSARLFIAGLGVVGVGLAAQVFGEYLDYARKVALRNEGIISRQGSAECRDGLEFELVPRRGDTATRVLNNREDWVAFNIPQLNVYFNCNLRLSARDK